MAAPPWLSTLPLAARLFYPFAVSGVAAGLTANSMLEAWSRAGPGIRRTVGLEVIRRVKGIEDSRALQRGLRKGLRPDPRRLPEALHKIRRPFVFTVRVEGVLIATGQATRQFINLAMETPSLTRSEMEQLVLETVEENEEYGITPTESFYEGGIRAGRAGLL